MYLKIFNAGLRLASLVMKLGLTLYMGKYLGLSELGTFGLVAAYVAIAIPLLGFRFDYIVTRDIVDLAPLPLALKMRDQAVFYGISYFGLVIILFASMFYSHEGWNPKLAIFTLSLCILESLATITTSNLISLKRQILANILFFIRAALWVFPVIVLGLLNPEFRNAETILSFWLMGVIISLLINAYIWRTLPWGDVIKTKVDWAWIKKGVKSCIFIWLGAVGAAAAGNVDRFVVEHFLNREFVGIASFYGSFVIAISALLGSGIFAFGYPQLISLHREGKTAEFKSITDKMTIQAAISAGVISIIIGVVIPYLGNLFERPEFSDNAPTLWLMLLGIWLKSVTESYHYVMYARHQDTPIWVGNILLLLVAFVSSYTLLPIYGFIAIGYSAVTSSIFLCAWRIFYVKKHVT